MQYSNYFIYNVKRKAFRIHTNKKVTETNSIKCLIQTIISIKTLIENNLSSFNIYFVITSKNSTKQYLIETEQNNSIKPEAWIYNINCNKRRKKYIGETSRKWKKNFMNIKLIFFVHNNTLSTLVVHSNKSNHNLFQLNVFLIKRSKNSLILKTLRT